jgi:hypothetical protein
VLITASVLENVTLVPIRQIISQPEAVPVELLQVASMRTRSRSAKYCQDDTIFIVGACIVISHALAFGVEFGVDLSFFRLWSRLVSVK